GEPEELPRLCAGAEPLLAAAANLITGYRREAAGDPDAALAATERALDLFADRPWPRAICHCRIAELCLHLERGARARDHLLAALPVLHRLGARADAAGVRSLLVLADLQVGDTAEAQRRLAGLARVALDEGEVRTVGYGLGIQGELSLARGEVEAGLRLWRRVADQVRDAGVVPSTGIPFDLDPWVVEARSAAVVAHARHGRLDLVADVAAALTGPLEHLLTHPPANPPPYLVERSLCGTLLLAAATADLARARTGNDRQRAARMLALAERMGFRRAFQPTMSAAAARADAERADRSAYREASSRYADLDPAGLRAAALDLLGRHPADGGQRVRSRL
ncbi:MAG: AfsR/SARP family transcriptional regulator, partial [Saccharothrix sp.]|nr:AfsR/SARP family transcriptional regulator [Saccharothrix sp.]